MLIVAKVRVRTMIEEHRHVVEALRDALLERDELVGAEILDVIARACGAPGEVAAAEALGRADIVTKSRDHQDEQ